jgi:hypothetical protein
MRAEHSRGRGVVAELYQDLPRCDRGAGRGIARDHAPSRVPTTMTRAVRPASTSFFIASSSADKHLLDRGKDPNVPQPPSGASAAALLPRGRADDGGTRFPPSSTRRRSSLSYSAA